MGRRKKKKQEELYEDVGFGPAPMAGVRDRARLTPLDVQQKVFRLAFRGYNERDVDQFLDQITEDLASLHEENKRLREELDLHGSPAGFDEAKRHAEETVRRAREDAARILADAERKAGLAVGVGGSLPPPSFLVRERDFLQQLAGLVQGHAESLKDDARRAREQQEGHPSSEPEADPDPRPEAAGPPPTPQPEATAPMESIASGPDASEGERPDAVPERQEPEGPWESRSSDESWLGGSEESFADQRSEVAGLASERKGREEEPSLRELFWGEE